MKNGIVRWKQIIAMVTIIAFLGVFCAWIIMRDDAVRAECDRKLERLEDKICDRLDNLEQNLISVIKGEKP